MSAVTEGKNERVQSVQLKSGRSAFLSCREATPTSGIARAHAVAGEKAKARKAYQDFFALWKDADPDIPILKQAKAEYAKLQ